ncbi:hypothetical protein [Coprococcus phoceensis]|uniref:hypothetical protein n=1 Tax=Coprococcus phoceensis TaxID=1870993 RepID=UPI003566A910
MYPVSDAFLSAVQENTRRYYWTGKITTKAGTMYEFSEKDIVKGSGYISSQCCGSTEIELGTVYSSEMGITLFLSVDRYSLEGAMVELFYHLCLKDGTYESIPMGIFEVSEANRTVKCLELKAYDYMLRFEEDFSGTSTVGTAYEIIMLCCGACNVEFAQTQEEIDAMPNGTEVLSAYSDNDIETYRDVLYYMGQMLGGFFVINREGKLELRKYENEPVMEITQKQRFSSSFSDFITRYTAISSTNLRTQTAEYYALETDDGLTMNLSTNPFLQFGLEETRKKLCENILTDIAVIAYVPFDSETIGNPALDLGDVIRFSGGHADGEQITCITSCQCKIGGKQTLKCVGKNPRLSQAKSKNDKNLVGLLNQIDEGKVGFFSFTNAKEFELGDTEIEVISIDFTAGEVTQAEFIGLVVLDVVADAVTRESNATGTITVPVPTTTQESGNTDASEEENTEEDSTEESTTEETTETVDVTVNVSLPVTWEEDGKAVVRARYSLNDTDIELFYPTQTYGTGKYTFPLYYPVNNVIPNLLNNFKVYFSVSGGTAKIEEGCCIATVTGQGLAAEVAAEWDGTLHIEDKIQKYNVLNWLKLGTLVDSVKVEKDSPNAYQLTQTVGKLTMTGFSMKFEEGSDS